MTQAFNLSQFANTLNTSGQASNSGLQNSSVTVTAGTGMSGGGSVALGSSVTLNNTGVTSLAAGTGISLSASTGAVTITNTGVTSAVLSAIAGNGIAVSSSTGNVTFSAACPTFNTVGSYCYVYWYDGRGLGYNLTSGTNYSVGSGFGQFQSTNTIGQLTNNLSGTWKWMSGTYTNSNCPSAVYGIACRVS